MVRVTFCVLTYGDYPGLARRVIESISQHCPRTGYQLVVGANAVGGETLLYLRALEENETIDRLIVSAENLNKCPIMRRMFEGIETDLIWWFDDDSFITRADAFDQWLRTAAEAPHQTVTWGKAACCVHPHAFAPDLKDVAAFVRSAPWYRGLPPPSWRPGGKGEFNFEGRGTGDGRWFFILGGCWLIRTRAIRALDWPDRRLVKLGDDVFLGEAIRQNGWALSDVGHGGVAIDTEPRRGDPGPSRVSS